MAGRAAAVGLLVVSNLVTNTRLPPAAYVPWNLALAAGLVGLARRDGCDAADLGMAAERLRTGLRAGAACAAPVAVVYGVALGSRGGRDVLRDQRVASLPTVTALYHAGVRIPLGTVLAEEVAFRGVLPALLSTSRAGEWAPRLTSSLLFGLWHVLPSRELTRSNVAVQRVTGGRSARAVPVAVAVTTLAGVVLHELRERAQHLAAPIIVHLAANVLGFVAARAVRRPA